MVQKQIVPQNTLNLLEIMLAETQKFQFSLVHSENNEIRSNTSRKFRKNCSKYSKQLGKGKSSSLIVRHSSYAIARIWSFGWKRSSLSKAPGISKQIARNKKTYKLWYLNKITELGLVGILAFLRRVWLRLRSLKPSKIMRI